MHEIEPFYEWRDYYVASQDKLSPFYGRRYSEFVFTEKVYNYYIHPQWDNFGSSTLYCKIIYVNYDKSVAVIEFIGEWNDTLHNDIMILKDNLINSMMDNGIHKFVLIGEQVLNFHGSDDLYYEQWQEEVAEMEGWIMAINFHGHVKSEMRQFNIHRYVEMSDNLDHLEWRKIKPVYMHKIAEEWMQLKLE